MSERATAGPWSVGHPRDASYCTEIPIHVGVGANRGNALAIVSLGGNGAIDGSRNAVMANARLIAAAPDLRAACEAVDLCFQRNLASGNFMGDDEHEAWNIVRAALSKAQPQTLSHQGEAR